MNKPMKEYFSKKILKSIGENYHHINFFTQPLKEKKRIKMDCEIH